MSVLTASKVAPLMSNSQAVFDPYRVSLEAKVVSVALRLHNVSAQMGGALVADSY